MKVLVFGAMGKTGKAVVERAVDAGHEVTAFVRGSVEGSALNVRVAEGDATKRADVDSAMRGQEAVIDTIGGKTPWKETTLESSAARTIIASMQANRVRRLLATSM
jgi:putative NADH-flavin reductase